jgi:hypothetical protein
LRQVVLLQMPLVSPNAGGSAEEKPARGKPVTHCPSVQAVEGRT